MGRRATIRINKPNKIGSVGMNNPKLSVYSSIFTDMGVKNAKDKKTIFG